MSDTELNNLSLHELKKYAKKVLESSKYENMKNILKHMTDEGDKKELMITYITAGLATKVIPPSVVPAPTGKAPSKSSSKSPSRSKSPSKTVDPSTKSPLFNVLFKLPNRQKEEEISLTVEELTAVGVPKKLAKFITKFHDIRTLCQGLELKSYTNMNKEERVDALIAKIEETGGAVPKPSKEEEPEEPEGEEDKPEADKSDKSEDGEKCGDYTKTALLNMRLSQLKKLLKKRGYDASEVENEDKARDLYCQSFNEEQCSAENGYKCGDGLVCNVSTKPGMCVSEDVGAIEPDWIEYKGRQIVGSKVALDKLRKVLQIERFKPPSLTTPEGIERARLIRKLVAQEIPEDILNQMPTWKIRKYIEHFEIKENEEDISDVIDRDEDEELSAEDVRKRAELMKNADLSEERENMIEMLASAYDKDPEYYRGKSDGRLTKLYRALIEKESEKLKKVTIDQEPTIIGEGKKKKGKKSKSEPEPEPTTEEEKEVSGEEPEKPKKKKEKKKKSKSEESEEEEPREKPKELSRDEANKVIQEVIEGTPNISKFTEVQNKVLKCLGLIP